MHGPAGKLRETVQAAGEKVTAAAKDTGKLVIAALAVSLTALALAAAALIAALALRRVAPA